MRLDQQPGDASAHLGVVDQGCREQLPDHGLALLDEETLGPREHGQPLRSIEGQLVGQAVAEKEDVATWGSWQWTKRSPDAKRWPQNATDAASAGGPAASSHNGREAPSAVANPFVISSVTSRW